MSKSPRFPPIAPESRNEAQRKLAEDIASGPRGGVRGPFLPLMHHPAFASHVQQIGGFLRYGTSIPHALVELAILVIARRWTCQFEWYAHAPIGLKAGLPQALVNEIALGKRPAAMDADQAIIFDVTSEIMQTGRLTDDNFSRAVERFGREGVIEIIGLCGYYSMLAFVLNVADDPLPDGAPAPLP